MRHMFLSVLAASVMILPVAAHATPVTYSGTATLTDSFNLNNVGFSGNTGFSFTNPPNSSQTVNLTIDATTYLGNQCDSCTDNLSVDVVFSSPNSNGQNYITGTGTVDGTITSTGAINWTSGENQVVSFTDGTSVTISLANISAGGFTHSHGAYTANDALTISVNSVPSAAAPEPSSLMLLGTGVLGAAGAIRRRLRA